MRNSDGNSAGRSSWGGVGASSFFSSSFGASGVGGLISVGCMRDQIFFVKPGTGIVNRGFLVRIINVVVAMYNGSAASISMPNTNPGKPCSWACNRWCQ